MKRLSKRDFMEFVVGLSEDGNVNEMQEMLDANPEHKQELLFGSRPGVDQGNYSVWAYSTWLCHFDGNRDNARRVVKWLLTEGHKPDIWLAIAMDDAARMRRILRGNSRLSQAEHPLFGNTALELASLKLRPLLLEHGADDGSIFTALFLGDLDRVRKMIRKDPKLIRNPAVGPKILYDALTGGQDDFACELIEQGVEVLEVDDKYTLLSMATTWGNPKATKALLAAGVDPNRRAGKFTPLSICVTRCKASPQVVAEIVTNLLEGGAEARPRAKIEGRTLLQWCEEKGLDEAAELIKRGSKK